MPADVGGQGTIVGPFIANIPPSTSKMQMNSPLNNTGECYICFLCVSWSTLSPSFLADFSFLFLQNGTYTSHSLHSRLLWPDSAK